MKQFFLIIFILFVVFSCSQTPVEVTGQNNTQVPTVNAAKSATVPEDEIFQDYDYNIYLREGDIAYVSSYENGLHIWLNVRRDVINNNTWLDYSIYRSGEGTLESGWGYIPNDDFTGGYEKGWCRLKTNTSESANPNFYRNNGSGGMIDISWEINNEWERQDGSYLIYSREDYKYARKRKGWDKSANASGTAIDWQIEKYPYGYIGWSEYSRIYIWIY